MLKFSIIIPVYNASRHLSACLDSVLAQTYTNFECVCVDDGSTDGSGELLDRYASQDMRFKIVHKPNGGEGSARNVGLATASGDWVTWLDSDDLYAPSRLEEAARIIEAEDPDMVRTRRMGGVEPDQVFRTLGGGVAYKVIDGYVNVQKWGWNTLAPGGMVWLWFVRRELLQGLLFRPECRVMTDAVFSIGLISRLKKVCQSDYRGYFYREVAGSLIRGSRRALDCVHHIDACCDVWKDCCAAAREYGFLPEVLTQMRNAGEGVVVDWATHRDVGRETPKDVAEVFSAFKRMQKLGAFSGRRTIYRYYGIPLFWWRITGRIGLLELWGWGLGLLNRILGRD